MDQPEQLLPGGVLVDFSSPFDRRFDPPEPETKRALTWSDIRGKGVGEYALSFAKRPRERLILLLAVRLYMSPAEISKLNLSQVTQKYGRDFRPRVYLKKRLVRKKDVADALIRYRRRDREAHWSPKEPICWNRYVGVTRQYESFSKGAFLELYQKLVRFHSRLFQV